MPKSHQSRSQPRSPDPAWDIEFEQVIRQLPHRPALLNHVRHHHPSMRLFKVDHTGALYHI